MMKSEWPVVEVKDACNLVVDCINNTAPTVEHETPYKMIRTPNIEDGHLYKDDVKYVEEEVYKKWTRRAKVNSGDVLLTREAPLGDVGLVREDDTIFLGQRIMQYRPDPDILDSRYLTYAFLSPFVQSQIHKYKGSGSVVDHIRVPECESLEIPLPPLKYQKKIAKLLNTFDRKIRLNTEMSKNLEQLGRAVYHEWFVKYTPYSDFKDSKKGKIPEDFQVKNLLDITNAILGYAFSSDEFNDDGDGTPLIRIRNLEDSKTETYTPEEYRDRYHVTPGDILVSMDGKFRSYIWRSREAALNQRVCKMEPSKRKYSNLFIHYLMEEPLYELEQTKTGTTVIHLAKKDLKKVDVVVPDDESLGAFNQLANPLLDKIVSINSEKEYLHEMRNTLLPKVISGEVEVNNITMGDEMVSIGG